MSATDRIMQLAHLLRRRHEYGEAGIPMSPEELAEESKALAFPESAPAEQGEELAALLSTLDDAVGDLEADGNPEYAEAIKQARHILTVLTQPKEPEAEASREALIDRIADLERALQAERGAYDDLAAFTASLPAPADEKALRAPRGDGSGGWILDYDYLSLIAKTMNQEFRVGMEEIEAVILAHEAPKDGSGKEEGR